MNGRGVGGRRRDDDRVLHGAVLPEGLDGVGHRRALLADGHVDALHVLTLLVQDRVHGHGGLAGLAVADDQLALAPADRDHGVDGLDPGLQRLVHGLAAHDARAPGSRPGGRCRPRSAPLPSTGSPSALTTRPSSASPTGTDRMRPVERTVWPSSMPSASPSTTAPIDVLVQVQRQPDRAVLELEQLVDRGVGEAGDAGDAVADLGHPPDGLGLQRGLEALEVLGEGGGDVVCGDGQLGHGRPSSWRRRCGCVGDVAVREVRGGS